MKVLAAFAVLMLAAAPALAKKDCNELRSTIEEKIKGKGVKAFTLEIVDKGAAKDGRIVGTCDGGKKEIVYKRG